MSPFQKYAEQICRDQRVARLIRILEQDRRKRVEVLLQGPYAEPRSRRC
jgi:hypothetical protein